MTMFMTRGFYFALIHPIISFCLVIRHINIVLFVLLWWSIFSQFSKVCVGRHDQRYHLCAFFLPVQIFVIWDPDFLFCVT